MSRSTLAVTGLVVAGVVLGLVTRAPVEAQAPARVDSGDAAVSALVTEVRALRTDMATASRNQLRAQLLLGRVQMQEQRIAYLDKQRADTAAMITMQSQMTSGLRNQVQGFRGDECARMPSQDGRRDCEAQAVALRRQLADLQNREQELRTHEQELETALSNEQARWSDFNARLDELERALR